MAYSETKHENKTYGAVHTPDSNVYQGVWTDCPPPASTDVASIGPNKPRPEEGASAEHLFGSWSD